MINLNDYPQSISEGVERYNHKDCVGSSKSLAIYTKSDGSRSAYCFRCGDRGYSRETHYKPPIKPVVALEWDTLSLPSDLTLEWNGWPARACIGMMRNRVTQGMTQLLGYGYSAEQQRLFLPFNNERGYLIGWQSKKVFEEDSRPKYLTASRKGITLMTHLHATPDLCVVVEDALSAVRLHGAGVSALSIQGTSLKDDHLYKLLNYKRVMVWLDNDNPTVRNRVVAIRNRVSVFIPCTMKGIQTEPKHLSDEEIMEELAR